MSAKELITSALEVIELASDPPMEPKEALAVLNDMIDRWNETPIFLPDPESEGPKP